jgi:histidinol dehydrogenase
MPTLQIKEQAMIDELDRTMAYFEDPDFLSRLERLRSKLITASRLTDYTGAEGRKLLEIVYDVVQRGDAAVAEYTKRFDGVRLAPRQFRLAPEDLKKAYQAMDSRLKATVKQAIENVRKYQQRIFVGNKRHPLTRYMPIERVGICVPGASAPLFSTVVMTAVPAQVAGVEQIAVVSPPRHKGTIHPLILAVCYMLGIEEVYRIGGPQAVVALAVGTKTIRQVGKLVGPGNKWVQTAKKIMAFDYVAIESIAGPSEVLIIANDSANAAWVAADMLSQAEHDPGSAVLFTDSRLLAQRVLAELKKQAKQLARSEQTVECLLKFGGIFVFRNLNQAIAEANNFAPEHLQVQCGRQNARIASEVRNAGAIFIGDYSPVAVGDYWAGPSHTLPTGASARFSSGLNANDFVKFVNVIEYDKKMLTDSAEHIIRLALAEGLDAHANSVRIRRDS